jgi:hypothetical protein
MILPTTVGDVDGLVVDADGLVSRDVGKSDVVIRLVIPGWRRFEKVLLYDVLLFRWEN